MKWVDSKEDLGKVEARMATKEDISTIRDDISFFKTTQQRQERLLQEILNRLPPRQ